MGGLSEQANLSDLDEVETTGETGLLLRQVRRLHEHLARLRSAVADALAEKVNMNVVATAEELPVSAPPREWYRVQGDPAIYVGNGSARPLTKLTPSAL